MVCVALNSAPVYISYTQTTYQALGGGAPKPVSMIWCHAGKGQILEVTTLSNPHSIVRCFTKSAI